MATILLCLWGPWVGDSERPCRGSSPVRPRVTGSGSHLGHRRLQWGHDWRLQWLTPGRGTWASMTQRALPGPPACGLPPGPACPGASGDSYPTARASRRNIPAKEGKQWGRPQPGPVSPLASPLPRGIGHKQVTQMQKKATATGWMRPLESECWKLGPQCSGVGGLERLQGRKVCLGERAEVVVARRTLSYVQVRLLLSRTLSCSSAFTAL